LSNFVGRKASLVVAGRLGIKVMRSAAGCGQHLKDFYYYFENPTITWIQGGVTYIEGPRKICGNCGKLRKIAENCGKK
jgi:hypothetical protein